MEERREERWVEPLVETRVAPRVESREAPRVEPLELEGTLVVPPVEALADQITRLGSRHRALRRRTATSFRCLRG